MKPSPSIAFFILSAAVLSAAEPVRKTLTSVSENVYVDAWEITGRVSTSSDAKWFVRKSTLHGGKQEGVDIIKVDNGRVQFTVVPTRGMSVLSLAAGDLRIGWQSPVKEVVHPQYINLQSRGGLGWLDGFNEWLVRCGLESNGFPGTDKFVNNQGDEASMELALHGKIGNLPASEVEVTVDPEPPHRIRVRGRVDERMFYGPKLELWTEISTEPGSDSVRVTDVVTNRGAEPQEFQLLYHTNYGKPLLDEGSTFLAPVSRVIPLNDHAAKSVANYPHYSGPTPGFVEQVYCLYPLGDDKDRTVIALANKAGDRAVSLRFSIKELPYVTLWKNTNSEIDGYVTGLEPGTNFPNNRRIERKFGRVPKLAPGASYHSTIDFGIHIGTEAVGRVASEISTIQAQKKPVIETAPEIKD
jgi:hypothetical protein